MTNQSSVGERKEKAKAMREERKSRSDEEFELIDVVGSSYTKAVVSRVVALDLSDKSTYVQLGVGGATGWLTGYMVGKVGRVMATAVGGTILLINMGTRAGYITVDWEKVDEDMKIASDEINKKLVEQKENEEAKKLFDKASLFVCRNLVTAGGFAAGFFLGIAC